MSMKIFIGYDKREPVAFHVLCHSILSRASAPVEIIPLVKKSLSVYTRDRGPLETTDFSMTRFMVPYLSGYKGISIFMDCDMLCLSDIIKIPFDYKHAVTVCQHYYIPSSDKKFLGQNQSRYPRKNWSSLMIFNNDKCRMLTPDYVNHISGLDLQKFYWLKDSEIGSLPIEWNWLVGEYYENHHSAKILHYTLGGPWFKEYKNCSHAKQWFDEYKEMTGPMTNVKY